MKAFVMNNRKLLLASCILLAAAAVVTVLGGRETARRNPPETQPAPPVGVYRGITLQLQAASPREPYETYIDEIAAAGANTVSLVLAAYQENASSTTITIDPQRTPSPQYLTKLIDHAHGKGMAVVIMPIVLLDNPREGEWRGRINPPDWDAWWQQYEKFIAHFAAIADKAKAEILMVGSELISTEKYADRWRKVIAAVRKIYSGKIGYSANWDHYRPVKYWDDLDIVGMTTYYDLTGGKEPTMDVLMESWAKVKREVLEWQAKVNRPILFTEVGWPNQETCAEFPWDYTRSPDKPDPRLQAMCFESFFRTFAGEPAVGGFLVWEWRSWPDQPVGPTDTSYVPCGKPAMTVIKKYLAGPPATVVATAPASQPASAPAQAVSKAD